MRKQVIGLLGFMLLLLAGVGQATTQPKFSIVPLTTTTIKVPVNAMATVRYLVTNNTLVTRSLTMVPIKGINQQTMNAAQCANPFVLAPHQSCELTLQLNGQELTSGVIAGPVICKTLTPTNSTPDPLLCSRVSQVNQLTVILDNNQAAMFTFSRSSLALSVNCPLTSTCTIKNAALTGHARQLTIQNTGSIAATNVRVNAPVLPAGTSLTTDCPSTLSAGSTCKILVSPGDVATADATNVACTVGYTPPVANTVTVTADNAEPTVIPLYVLGYGCQYQGGFLYAVDDTQGCTSTPCSGSIGGKVISLVNQSSGIIWGSDNNGNYDGGVSIWGIAETSTPTSPVPNSSSSPPAMLYPNQQNCDGATDGACNSANILIYYNNQGPNPPVNVNYYAAGLCTLPINGHADWYLPAICELGWSQVGTNAGCPSGGQDLFETLPKLVMNMCALGANCLAGDYWSSTEYSVHAQVLAWSELISSGGSVQNPVDKNSSPRVRCARALSL